MSWSALHSHVLAMSCGALQPAQAYSHDRDGCVTKQHLSRLQHQIDLYSFHAGRCLLAVRQVSDQAFFTCPSLPLFRATDVDRRVSNHNLCLCLCPEQKRSSMHRLGRRRVPGTHLAVPDAKPDAFLMTRNGNRYPQGEKVVECTHPWRAMTADKVSKMALWK